MIVAMEAPPSYSPQPKKSKTGLIIGLVLGGIVLCCLLPIGVVAGLGFYGVGKMKGMVACAAGFTDLQQALRDYADEHDGKLPKATTWMEDVRPYYAKRMARHGKEAGPFSFMPAEGVFSCTDENGVKTGIAYNTDVSGKAIKALKDPRSTVLIFETESASPNLAEKYKAREKANSPKFMGNHRGWMYANVEGDPHTGDFNNSGKFGAIKIEKEVKTGTDSNK